MKGSTVTATFGLFTVFMWLISVVGWISNLVQIVCAVMNDVPLSALIIAKIVGVFAIPLGSVLGLCGLF